jgi:hypothetical protein
MTQFRRISLAAMLTLCMTAVSYGGTITGSRTGATGEQVGTITGSRTGTITGSRTGTITGSRTGTITGSNARTTGGFGSINDQEGFVFTMRLLLTALGW